MEPVVSTMNITSSPLPTTGAEFRLIWIEAWPRLKLISDWLRAAALNRSTDLEGPLVPLWKEKGLAPVVRACLPDGVALLVVEIDAHVRCGFAGGRHLEGNALMKEEAPVLLHVSPPGFAGLSLAHETAPESPVVQVAPLASSQKSGSRSPVPHASAGSARPLAPESATRHSNPRSRARCSARHGPACQRGCRGRLTREVISGCKVGLRRGHALHAAPLALVRPPVAPVRSV